MSGVVSDRKRLLNVTGGNCRNHTLSVAGHRDFFPRGDGFRIELVGLNRAVETGLPIDGRTGRPRATLRGRAWVRDFFDRHRIAPGDVIALERLDDRRYRLYPFENRAERRTDWRRFLDDEPPGAGPTVIELFAGCGGMALGFRRAGFRTQLCNEWDAAAAETIRRNITPRVAQCAIQEIDAFSRADVIAGGPPCQGFSNLGERVPDDPRNQLWRSYVRAVVQSQPRVFVLENVPPLLNSEEFAQLERTLTAQGYRIAAEVLNAADFGVPQARKRAIVIGSRVGEPSLPAPTTPNRPRTVRDAIGDLPAEPTGQDWHVGRNPTELSRARYRCIPPGGNRWDLPPELMPECWKRKVKGGTDLFGRLWWDRPSVTIRTEFFKPEKGRYLHPQADRPITHREAARLQGFPDDFEFAGTKIEVARQIGNAVPPMLAEAIARHVRTVLLPADEAAGEGPGPGVCG
jgi:DNA (cytosine-5)-methyltransferase 1